MNKFLFIINPISGHGKGEKLIPEIRNFLIQNNINHEIRLTQYPKHATQIVKDEIGDFNTIVSVGGDGTLNEVINGIDENHYERISVAVLPIGTGNDFVKNIKLTNNLNENLSFITGKKENSLKKIDLGLVEFTNGHLTEIKKHSFINGAGIGFDAYVGALTQNHKMLPGIFAYLVSVIKALFNFKMISGKYIVDNEAVTGEKLMISIGNGISHGGGFYLTPDGIIDDGQLNISIFDKITRRRLLAALPKALVNKVKTLPEVTFYKSNGIDIKLHLPYYLHCDGEIITNSLSTAKFSIRNKVLTIIEMMN